MEQNTRRFDACIFDLDGTLANTLTSIAHFGNATLGEFGLPEIPVEQYKQLVGNGADLLMRRMLKTVGAAARFTSLLMMQPRPTRPESRLFSSVRRPLRRISTAWPYPRAS